ncbi:hypothetical protein N7520_011343 [Penicillium odoratum]|uniref:uncharacterized protein n=1 Tax=Penicillium odoratum TaxID=1167516 RepID=UPI002547B007|nr:uncharacterized protein N7520_011343 [Penicillium odoratum]KAJ5746161.1 hypothetical protein N7520_011343 [Penicillium odoratum]
MADNLTQSLDALSLNRDEPDSLLFTPHHNHDAWLGETFDQVPRYLFCVSFENISDGETTNIWAKSKYAKHGTSGQEIDILKGDRVGMAFMLNNHLRWKRRTSSNLLSWTSSLLFALQCVFYRYHRDNVPLKDITLFIVDTTKLPRGAFVRDMDLITIFKDYNDELRGLENLRTEFRTLNDSEFGCCYYFGEYLSQGALKIEGKCSFTTAQNIIDMGLFDLMPEFKASFEKDLGLAKRVLELRGCFGQNPVERDIARQLPFAVSIGNLFGRGWQLPVAANLMGLQRRSEEDVDVICEALIKVATGKVKMLFIFNIILTF